MKAAAPAYEITLIEASTLAWMIRAGYRCSAHRCGMTPTFRCSYTKASGPVVTTKASKHLCGFHAQGFSERHGVPLPDVRHGVVA